MTTELTRLVEEAVNKLYKVKSQVVITRPEEQFGDFATNVALQIAPQAGKSPREIAEALAAEISKAETIRSVEVAGPGFINIRVTDGEILAGARSAANVPKTLAGQEILIEFGDPNPFKEMHIGHVYSYITGDAIASLLEAVGAKVRRLSYHGDVGLHVAKTIWAARRNGGFGDDDSAIGQRYAEGAEAYDTDAAARAEIDEINQKIYSRSDPEINQLYDLGKKTSFDYFDTLLKELDIAPAKRFLESESADKGLKLVRQHEGKVFEKSEGAVVYKGEKDGLHTRVFISSAGLPTYEAKDLGLAELKKEVYPTAVCSIIITAHEQAEYFKVMLAALREFDPTTADATIHLYHGFVSLSTGKMSSRTGRVYGARNLIDDVEQAVSKQFEHKSRFTRNAAIKYGFLKHRLGSDITYDVEESVSLDGNSGPYLQYAHARAAGILDKAKPGDKSLQLDEYERSLALKISQYPEVVGIAANEYMPHQIGSYLYELSQNFNRFYEHCRVAGDPREGLRAGLVKAYKDVLAHGLKVLNIEAPEKV